MGIIDCNYSVTGSGPAIFLTHGVGGAEDAWRFIAPKLKDRFTIVTYDLRGHGKSPVDNKDFNLDDLVLDLERVREKTNIQKAHFMGHSLGGMIAPAYAKKFPERVLSVGLLSTVAGRSDEDKQKVWNVILDLKDKGVEQTLKNLTNRWFTDNFIEKNPDLVSRRLKQVIDTDKDVFINVFKIYAETEMISWLKDIKKPCLFMTGENDGGCTPVHNKKMSNEIKDSKLVIIPEVKHSFLIEAPDQIANNLIEFIENI
ncbi:alpha/beta hydrolase [Pelagibacterales bacterium SAG-MED17]|nr:alpha/beta hydrolase [Pelagibacterales bacterium SAG-MED17]